jgi:hypothetical protein
VNLQSPLGRSGYQLVRLFLGNFLAKCRVLIVDENIVVLGFAIRSVTPLGDVDKEMVLLENIVIASKYNIRVKGPSSLIIVSSSRRGK